jgi:hypothetical protein
VTRELWVRRFAIDTPIPDAQIPTDAWRFPAISAALSPYSTRCPRIPYYRGILWTAYDFTHPDRDAIAWPTIVVCALPITQSIWGVMSAPERSFLLPCMHDEPYAYHRISTWQMRHARGISAIRAGERDFIIARTASPERVTHHRPSASIAPRAREAQRFRARFNICCRDAFFAGAVYASKNVPMLLHDVQIQITPPPKNEPPSSCQQGVILLELSRYQQRSVSNT